MIQLKTSPVARGQTLIDRGRSGPRPARSPSGSAGRARTRAGCRPCRRCCRVEDPLVEIGVALPEHAFDRLADGRRLAKGGRDKRNAGHDVEYENAARRRNPFTAGARPRNFPAACTSLSVPHEIELPGTEARHRQAGRPFRRVPGRPVHHPARAGRAPGRLRWPLRAADHGEESRPPIFPRGAADRLARGRGPISAAMADGNGAATEGKGPRHVSNSVLSFKFKDNFSNEGTCTLQRNLKGDYVLTMTVTKVGRDHAAPFLRRTSCSKRPPPARPRRRIGQAPACKRHLRNYGIFQINGISEGRRTGLLRLNGLGPR